MNGSEVHTSITFRGVPHGALRPTYSSHFKDGLTLLAHDPFNRHQGQSWLRLPSATWSPTSMENSLVGHCAGMARKTYNYSNYSGNWIYAVLLRILQITTSKGDQSSCSGFFLHVCNCAKAPLYLIFAKYISLGNAEQQGIGNLPSSTSHQNSDRLSLQDTMLWAPERNWHLNCLEHMVEVFIRVRRIYSSRGQLNIDASSHICMCYITKGVYSFNVNSYPLQQYSFNSTNWTRCTTNQTPENNREKNAEGSHAFTKRILWIFYVKNHNLNVCLARLQRIRNRQTSPVSTHHDDTTVWMSSFSYRFCHLWALFKRLTDHDTCSCLTAKGCCWYL